MTNHPIPVISNPEITTTFRYGGDVILSLRDLITDINLSPLFEGWRPIIDTQFLFRSNKIAMSDTDQSNEVSIVFDDVINHTENMVLHIPAFTDADDTLLLQNHPQIINNKVLGTNISVAGDFDFDNFAILNAVISAGSNTISGLTNSNLSGSAGITDTNLAQITNKAKLPSTIVYTDQANVFADLDQTFRTGRLRIFNSSFFPYVFQTSAITAPRNVTLPLLLTDDEIAFIAHAQALTQKTIDSVQNILKNLGESNIVVFQDSADSNWKARNTKTGVIISSNASLTAVLQAAIDGLTVSRTIIETVKVIGVGQIDQITVPSYTRLNLIDSYLTLINHVSPAVTNPMFINSDIINGNVEIQILPGILDGNRANQNPYNVSPPGDEDTANIIQMTKVTNPKVIGGKIINACSRGVRFRDCINPIAYDVTGDDINAEGLQARGGTRARFIYNHLTNTKASFISTHECPGTIIHGNYGKTNTGPHSGYNISSLDTIFTDNWGNDTGSAVLTMSEATETHLGSYSIIANNNLSGSRAVEGVSILSAINQTGLIIKGNQFHHNFRHGIRIASLKTAIQIEGNHAYENGMGGISVHSGGGLTPDQVSIHDNFCWNNNTSGSVNNHEKCGIAVFSSTPGEFVLNVSVHHNHCFDTHTVNADKTQIYGIYIEDTTNASVSFNNCIGNKTDGILVEGTNTGLRMFENPGYSLDTPIATTNGVETWTNKTLTSPVINSATLSGIFTLPTGATPITLSKPNSGAEIFMDFVIDDASGSRLRIQNSTGSAGVFVPLFGFRNLSTNAGFPAGIFNGEIINTADSGTVGVFRIDGRIVSPSATALTIRPIFDIVNFGTQEYVFGPTQADFKNNEIINAVIDGLDNTITNIPDTALSSNVPLLDTANTFTNLQRIELDAESQLYLYRPNSTVGDKIGVLFEGDNASSEKISYGQLYFSLSDDDADTEDSNFGILTMSGGTFKNRLFVSNNGNLFIGDNQRVILSDSGQTVAHTFTFPDQSGEIALQGSLGSIDDLTDVDTSTSAPANNDVLTWNSTNSEWVPAAPPGASGGEANTISNVGTGVQLAKPKVGVDIPLRTLSGNINFELTENTDDITFAIKNIGEALYEVFFDGTNWHARNTKTGIITSSNTSLTTVLQAAIDGLTGGRTWKETVKVSGNGSFGQIIIPSYTRLDFTEFKLTVITNTNKSVITNTITPYHATNNPVLASAVSDIEIVGGYFDGNRYNQSDTTSVDQDKNLIYFENATNVTIYNPWIIRPQNDGIRLRSCTNCEIYNPYVEDSRSEGLSVVDSLSVTVLNPYITSTGWSFMTTKNSPYTQFIGGWCETNGILGGVASGINISSPNSYAYGITVIDTTNSGMTLGDNASSVEFDPSGTVVNNCRFENTDGPGIRCNTYPARNIKIVTCTIEDSQERGIALGTNIENFEINNNIIAGCQESGILVNGSTAAGICRNITIDSNIIYNCGKSLSANDHERSAIALYGNDVDTVENILVQNNICYDNQGTKTQKYGVMLRNTNRVQMRFNSLYNNLTDGYLLADTNNNPDIIGNLGHSVENRLVGTQQANVFGVFTQTFRTGRLRIGNTAFTQFVTFNNASGTNSVDLIIPVLTASDTIVTEAFPQTLLSKTLTSPTINSGTLSGNFTLPSSPVGTGIKFIKPAGTGSEKFFTFEVADDVTGSSLTIENLTTSDARFVPGMVFSQYATELAPAGYFLGRIDPSDDVVNEIAVFAINSRHNSAAVTNRPLFGIENYTTKEYLFYPTYADFKTHEIRNAGIDATENTLSNIPVIAIAEGTSLQVIRTNSAGNGVEWASLDSERTGKALANGNGSTTVFNIAHGLGSTPSYAFVDCSSHAIARTFTVDATNITVTFTSAPSSGTNNVIIYWRVIA